MSSILSITRIHVSFHVIKGANGHIQCECLHIIPWKQGHSVRIDKAAMNSGTEVKPITTQPFIRLQGKFIWGRKREPMAQKVRLKCGKWVARLLYTTWKICEPFMDTFLVGALFRFLVIGIYYPTKQDGWSKDAWLERVYAMWEVGWAECCKVSQATKNISMVCVFETFALGW